MEKRLNYFDSLRGIAAFSVVIFHIINSHWAWNFEAKLSLLVFNGADAVSFFFVLSGLVLSKKYFETQENLENFSIKKYSIARLFRLMPVYWFVICIVYLYQFRNEGFGYTFIRNLICNEHHFLEQSLLVRGWTESICLPAWSLGVELAISLFLPVLIISYKVNSKLIFFVLLLIIIANKNYFSVFIFHFILGLVISKNFNLIQENKINWLEKHRKVIFLISVLLFSYRQILNIFPPIPPKIQTFLNDLLQLDPFFLTGLGSFGLICIVIRSKKTQQLLTKKIFIFLGLISYPMYLIHCFFIGIFLDNIAKFELHYGNNYTFIIMTIFVVSSTVVSSFLIHKLIENPFIKIGKRTSSNMGK